MDFVRKIVKLDDVELEQFVIDRINLLEDNQKKRNISDTIGYLLDYKASCYDLLNFTDEALKVDMVPKFDGYIPFGTRIVYGMAYKTKERIVSSGGCFYYLDDDEYILDFCKFIKDKKICDEFELFDYVLEFCQKYFGVIKVLKREEMIKLIYKNDKAFFDPINDSTFSLFKGKGNSMCTEFAVMTQNILSFLGFNISLIIGSLKLDDSQEEAHAFNMIDFEYSKTKKDLSILLDMSSSSYVVNINCNKIGIAPYIYFLDRQKDEIFKDLVTGNISEIECPNYFYMYTLENILKFVQEYCRHYSIKTILNKKENINEKIYKKV